MKATRRHELKENDLAHAIGVAREYLSEHGARVGILVLAAVAVVAVIGITSQTQTGNIEQAWTQKSQLVFDNPETGKESIDRLRAFTDASTDTTFLLTGLIEQGQHALRLAQQVDIPPDPDLNNRAREAYESLLQRFPENPLAFGVAHSGLATVVENDFALDSDLAHRERARGLLQAIIDNPALAATPFHRLATDRLDELEGVFSIIRFAPPEAPEAPVAVEGTPIPFTVTPTLIPADEVPANLRKISDFSGKAINEPASVDGETEPVDELVEEVPIDEPVDPVPPDAEGESANTP